MLNLQNFSSSDTFADAILITSFFHLFYSFSQVLCHEMFHVFIV